MEGLINFKCRDWGVLTVGMNPAKSWREWRGEQCRSIGVFGLSRGSSECKGPGPGMCRSVMLKHQQKPQELD